MKRRLFLLSMLIAAILSFHRPVHTQQPAALVPAHFHHVHLNSVNPAAAAEYYTKAFTTATHTQFAGFEAVKTGNIHILFTKVDRAPATQPQSAVWHFGWNTPDSRQYLEKFHAMKLEVVPMVNAYDGGVIEISSDALPGYLTKQQIDDARKAGVQPPRTAGFQYLRGPDGSLIENAGNSPTERFNHVHLFHKDPQCANAWYVTHLGASLTMPGAPAGGAAPSGDCHKPYSEVTWPAFNKEGMVREPAGGVFFDDISLSMRPWVGAPLVSPRGQIVDHIGLSVADLDGTLARLRSEGVKVTEPPHAWGGTRAAMIEGPDLIAIELVEVK